MATGADRAVRIPNADTVDFSKFIVLKSDDDVFYQLPKEAADMSTVLKPMLEGMEESDAKVFPATNVAGEQLQYIAQYMAYHYDNPAEPIEKPLKGKVQDSICEWDKTFIFTDLVEGGDEKKHERLLKVYMAANYLGVKDLLTLCAATIASIAKGKTVEEIRDVFHIRPKDAKA